MKQSPNASTRDLNLRAQVVKTLLAVQNGQSLQSVLAQHINIVSDKDRALYHELVLGCLRQWHALKQVTLPLLSVPLENAVVETCLYVGLYQLLCTRVAAHAAISETVEASKQLGMESLSGVVNAILRRATRETEQFYDVLENASNLPSWLAKRLKKDWGEQLAELSYELKQVAPLTLRVNTRQVSRDEYLDILEDEGIDAHRCEISEVGIVMDESLHVPSLPGFEAGGFSVQDEHAQLCATLLPNLDGKFVVDACAAPGGKTAHILETFNVKKLIALDQDEKRLKRVSENLDRLVLDGKHVEVITADAAKWTAPELVDCIVLDAPCSAVGVIRRHPDIRLLRQSTDIPKTVALQKQILENMWQQLKVGGTMLYITCSILKAENEQQMVEFFANHADAQESKIEADWGVEQIHGRQLFPQVGHGDGFYYCRIVKTA